MSPDAPLVPLAELAPLLTRAELEAVLHARNVAWCRTAEPHIPYPAADATMPTQTDTDVTAPAWRDPLRAPDGPKTPAELEALIDHARYGSFMLLPVHGRALVAEIDRLRKELAALSAERAA